MNSGQFSEIMGQLGRINANLTRLIEIEDEKRRTLNRVDGRLKELTDALAPPTTPTATRKTVAGSKQ